MNAEETDRLIFDYLSGRLSEEESEKVIKWIEANEEHRLYFRKFKEDFLYMRWGVRSRLIAGDTTRLFQAISRRHRFRMLKSIAAAVVFILCIGGGWFLYSRLNTGTPWVAVNNAPILPGKPQATLILSTGEKIRLDSLNGEVNEQNGVSIQVDAGGSLSYRFVDSVKQLGELFNQITIPRGGEYMMQLADGTRVWLNAATEFRYPLAFRGEQRKVYLKGEAYFEVSKDSLHPFIVMADDIRVKVYGTCFNVNNYDEGKVQTVLVEGAVGMRKQDREVRLKPGQKGESGGEGIKISEVDPYAYVAWKEGNFVFENERLEEVMDKLARWYDIEIFYIHESSRNIRLSGDMKRYKDIQSLLYYFEQISDVKFEIKGRGVIVK